jgi:hypothetical protein
VDGDAFCAKFQKTQRVPLAFGSGIAPICSRLSRFTLFSLKEKSMSSFRCTLLACAAGLVLGATAMNFNGSIADDSATVPGVYELRVYTTEEGRLPALEKRFKDHTLKLFEKHGIKNVMYWKPTDAAKSKNTLIYVLWHKSEAAAKESFKNFIADPEWKAAAAESEKDGKIVAKIESTFMTATEWSPKAH